MALVGKVKLARVLGVDVKRIPELVKEGMPCHTSGKFEMAVCLVWWVRYLQKLVTRTKYALDDPLVGSLRAERHRFIKLAADREELALARQRGDVVPMQMYREVMGAKLLTLRGRLLSLPARFAQDREERTRWDDAIYNMLSALATGGAGQPAIREMLLRAAGS